MTHGLRPRLTIPKLLAVSALGLVAGCPSDDQGDTGNESGPSMTTSGEGTTTTGSEGSTSTAAATGETTAADSGSGATETGTDTGALPDCQDNLDQPTCEATMSCVFLPELGGCIIDCTIVEDEVTCMEQLGCEWYGDFCDFEPIA